MALQSRGLLKLPVNPGVPFSDFFLTNCLIRPAGDWVNKNMTPAGIILTFTQASWKQLMGQITRITAASGVANKRPLDVLFMHAAEGD